jgi:predicted GNAT superfamily acetyltransferase
MSPEITIRPASSPDDYRACQNAQRVAWGLTEENYVVPVATMVGAQLHGGLVLGAFLEDGTAVGVSFAFLGKVGGRLCLYSQLTGIAPGYQDRGLGTQLKLAQRDFALNQGIQVIAWAFDPLQSGNARFNLDKLGATVSHYIVDMYGPRTDSLSAGTPTDRLIAEWETSPKPRSGVPEDEIESIRPLIEARTRPDGLREVLSVRPPAGEPRLRLEVPSNLNALRSADPPLTALWRDAVRQAFLLAFADGYKATGFARSTHPEGVRCDYLLEKA